MIYKRSSDTEDWNSDNWPDNLLCPSEEYILEYNKTENNYNNIL